MAFAACIDNAPSVAEPTTAVTSTTRPDEDDTTQQQGAHTVPIVQMVEGSAAAPTIAVLLKTAAAVPTLKPTRPLMSMAQSAVSINGILTSNSAVKVQK